MNQNSSHASALKHDDYVCMTTEFHYLPQILIIGRRAGECTEFKTKGATVTGCASVISFCCKGLYKYDKQS